MHETLLFSSQHVWSGSFQAAAVSFLNWRQKQSAPLTDAQPPSAERATVMDPEHMDYDPLNMP